jgi:hypothetical protein
LNSEDRGDVILQNVGSHTTQKTTVDIFIAMRASDLRFPHFNLNFSANSGATEMPPLPGSSGGEPTAANSDLGPEIPEGVDPSFLAALPDEMREEVIAEQLRYENLCTIEFHFKGLTRDFLQHLKSVVSELAQSTGL